MNYTSLSSPEKLQETYRLMLMTLEYGGSVNTKVLEEFEKEILKSSSKLEDLINT